MLIVGLLVGSGTAINRERYNDSLRSLQSTIQQQYAEAVNVSNENTGKLACSGETVPVGQSSCVLLGKYITPSSDGKLLNIKNVLGVKGDSFSLDDAQGKSEADVLKNQIGIMISPVGEQTYATEWDTKMTIPKSSNPIKFSMLVVHSPVSGLIRTFIDSSQIISDNEINSILLDDKNLDNSLEICVDPNDLFRGKQSSIFISADAVSSSGVDMRGDAISGC